jgi:hypothetical protein
VRTRSLLRCRAHVSASFRFHFKLELPLLEGVYGVLSPSDLHSCFGYDGFHV